MSRKTGKMVITEKEPSKKCLLLQTVVQILCGNFLDGYRISTVLHWLFEQCGDTERIAIIFMVSFYLGVFLYFWCMIGWLSNRSFDSCKCSSTTMCNAVTISTMLHFLTERVFHVPTRMHVCIHPASWKSGRKSKPLLIKGTICHSLWCLKQSYFVYHGALVCNRKPSRCSYTSRSVSSCSSLSQ